MAFVRDPTNLIPIMTSNTAPSGTASASSDQGAAYAAWKAMNGSQAVGDYWNNLSGEVDYLRYALATPKVSNKYNVYPANGGEQWAPSRWTYDGWDGTTWHVLDTQSSISFSGLDGRSFFLSNAVAYLAYQLNITQSSGNYYICVGEFEICGVGSSHQCMVGGM